MLTRVDKPALLKRLFEVGSLYSGQILSFTKMLGQLQDAGNTITLSHYLNMLSDCGLLKGLEKYAGDVIRKRGSSPKFQVYNNALLTSHGDSKFSDVLNESKNWGRLVESSVGAHLINNSLPERYNVYYWRKEIRRSILFWRKTEKLLRLRLKAEGEVIIPE